LIPFDTSERTAVTDEQMIEVNYRHYASLFPRACGACGRTFVTLRDYVLATERLGATISYDAELKEWKTTTPLGAAALVNCPCGSTLSLTTDGIALDVIHQMLEWIRVETERRGVTANELLDDIRDHIRVRALADPEMGGVP
jgi:hypothetical protein